MSDALSVSYDLRNHSRVPAIRSQSPWGTCRAFASTGSIESNLMTQKFADSDLISVIASQPVTFIIGEWLNDDGSKAEAYDIKVFIDDEAHEEIEISDSEIEIKIESEELYISAEE